MGKINTKASILFTLPIVKDAGGGNRAIATDQDGVVYLFKLTDDQLKNLATIKKKEIISELTITPEYATNLAIAILSGDARSKTAPNGDRALAAMVIASAYRKYREVEKG